MGSKPKVVAFLGPRASYTHQATINVFPESEYSITAQTTIEDVFAAVQNDKASYGVVPFENSSNGSVVFTLDLFTDPHARYPEILVCGEIYLPVHHCLVGHAPKDLPTSSAGVASRILNHDPESPDVSGAVTPTQATPQPPKSRVKPLHDLKHVKKIYSHPQAWGQCKLFLSSYLKNIERQDVSSTSRAADLVGHDDSHASAAISSKIAAQVNGLDVLAEDIEDNEGNSTRFFILRRGPELSSSESTEELDDAVAMERFKSLVSFSVDHVEPGALADCLEVFKRFKLNLTSINTRPSGDAPWHYIFFVEFMGRRRNEGKGGAVNDALKELTRVAKDWRWLGSWEIAPKV